MLHKSYRPVLDKCLQGLIIFPFVSDLHRIGFFLCVFSTAFFSRDSFDGGNGSNRYSKEVYDTIERFLFTDSISFIIILSSFCSASFLFCFNFLIKYVSTVTVALMGFKTEYLTVQFASFFARCCLLILRRSFVLIFKFSCT